MDVNGRQMTLKFDKVPIGALSIKTIQVLATGFNDTKVFLTEDGFPRDYRGLAYFAGIDVRDVSNESNPTLKLFNQWSKQTKNTCTLAKLQQIFGLIDRYDIYDDTHLLFGELIFISM